MKIAATIFGTLLVAGAVSVAHGATAHYHVVNEAKSPIVITADTNRENHRLEPGNRQTWTRINVGDVPTFRAFRPEDCDERNVPLPGREPLYSDTFASLRVIGTPPFVKIGGSIRWTGSKLEWAD